MALQVWLPLNGDLHNYGLRNITITKNVEDTYVDNGKIGKALATGQISMSAEDMKYIFRNNTFSICFWVYINADTGDTTKRAMFFGNNSPRRYSLFQYSTCNDLHWSWANDTTNNVSGVYAGALPSYTWTHLAITYDSSLLKIYLNGELKRIMTVTYSPISLDYTTLLFSNCANNGRYLNDYRIYDHALSAKEVEEISKGLILHYKLDNNGLGNLNLIKGQFSSLTTNSNHTTKGSITYDTSILALNDLKGKTLYFSYDYSVEGDKLNHTGNWSDDRYGIHGNLQYVDSGGTTKTAYPFAGYLEASGTGRAIQRYTVPIDAQNINSLTFATQVFNRPNSENFNTWYIKNVKLELDKATSYTPNLSEIGGNSSIIYDSSGYQNNGIIYGNVGINSNSAKYLACTYLPSGNTDYIVTKNTIGNPTDTITMNIWFKSTCTTPGNDYHEIFNIATATQNYEFAIHKTGFFRGGMVINGTRQVANTAVLNLLDGKWHMLTMTYDGINLIRYVDGIEKSRTAATGPLTGNCKFMMGHYGTNTGYYTKEMYLNDARIYATALTDKQIKELYDTSATADKNGNMYGRELIE